MAHFTAEQGLPLPVHWAGWQTDTYRLKCCGWEIAMDERMENDDLHVCFHHRQLAITGLGRMQRYREMMYRRMIGYNGHEDYLNSREFPPVNVYAMATKGGFNYHGDLGLARMSWVDPTPTMIQVEQGELHTLPLFAALHVPRAEELIVEPADVSALLDQIKRMQSPRMALIRTSEARRDREAGTVKQFHASVVSIR